jgi:hypothetical protein
MTDEVIVIRPEYRNGKWTGRNTECKWRKTVANDGTVWLIPDDGGPAFPLPAADSKT